MIVCVGRRKGKITFSKGREKGITECSGSASLDSFLAFLLSPHKMIYVFSSAFTKKRTSPPEYAEIIRKCCKSRRESCQSI